ncbi:ORC1-type DNA replication protein [Methanobacterium petrolearium]|uniref:ORC1-type DNA replication protein n=1 Tax=Methanobacterium petrolearium TaxID=710190 RepID=UPI001AE74C57|nr:ORC1-type DNA replication protein [Methanobacterium petrolearium]MBP1946667.1 cell division control protein 6 [Methanobacterium petrolearium]
MPDRVEDILMGEETLFKDITVFNPDYIPENFLHRESQMEALALCLRPALKGGKPVNSVVIGSPATGKTTAIHKIFEMVERKSQKVATAYVNCQLYNTRFNIFAQIYKQLFGFLPAGTGVPFSRIYGEIMKKLSNEKKALVVALDDVNHLFYHKNANQILYDILRAYEVFPGVRTGVFAIISDIEFRFLLDKNVSSVFIPQEVMFQTYTWQEMRDILNERVKSGFYPSVVPDEILDEIVDVTSSTGDLRVGIDLLRTSGNFAEADASKTIAKKHLDKALHDIGSQSIQNTLDNLSADERELLRVLVQRGDDNPTAGDLYNTLKEYRSLSYASFDRVLKKLEFMRIIDTKFTGKGKRGNSRLILLRFDSKELGKWLD